MYTFKSGVMYSQCMRRTQIYLDEELLDRLRQFAATEGRSAAAVIRDALRAYLAPSPESEHDDPIMAMAGAFSGLAADASVEHDRDLYGASPKGATPP